MPARWLHQGPASCPAHCLKVLRSPQIFADGGAQSRAHISSLPGASLANRAAGWRAPGGGRKWISVAVPRRGVSVSSGVPSLLCIHTGCQESLQLAQEGGGQEFQILQLEATKPLLLPKVPSMGTLFPSWESCVLQAEGSSSRVGVCPLETPAMPPPLRLRI